MPRTRKKIASPAAVPITAKPKTVVEKGKDDEDIRVTIKNVFHCQICESDLTLPVELTCGHITCKRCVSRNSHCPTCKKGMKNVGWNYRYDITDLYKSCKELIRCFELETHGESEIGSNGNDSPRLDVTNVVVEELPTPECGRLDHTNKAGTPNSSEKLTPTTTEEKQNINTKNESSVIETTENPCVTTWENSEAVEPEINEPHTPDAPYPFNNETEIQETKQDVRNFQGQEISNTQLVPLIDTQFFSSCNDPDKAKSQVKVEKVDESEVLDLSIPKGTPKKNVSRKRAFSYVSPSLAMDLRIRRKFLAITSGEDTFNCTDFSVLADVAEDEKFEFHQSEMNTTQLVPPPSIIPEKESPLILPIKGKPKNNGTDVKRTQRVPSPLILPEKSSSPLILPSKRIPAMRTESNMNRTQSVSSSLIPPQNSSSSLIIPNKGMSITGIDSDVFVTKEKIIEPTSVETEFEDDDFLLLEAEDCINLVNGHKRRADDDESSEEFFPPSIVENKRLKIISKGRSPNATNLNKCSESSKVCDKIKAPIAETEETLGIDKNDEDDPFGPSWTPPEEILDEEIQNLQRKFVFCSTRLNRTETQKLNELSIMCDGKVTREYTNDVTHLVLTLENNRISQTMKYLYAIAGKKWILTFDWVEESLKQGKVVAEDPFETSNFVECDPGVKVSRLTKSHLFEDFNFYVLSDMKSSIILSSDCKKLLTSLGGVVLEELPLTNERLLVVGDPLGFRVNFQELYEERGWLAVSADWILECILTYSLIPFLPHHVLTPGVDGVVISQLACPLPLLAT